MWAVFRQAENQIKAMVWLVELRGFEPMAIAGAAKEAVQHPPQPATQS
jgi:hypothetical protein